VPEHAAVFPVGIPSDHRFVEIGEGVGAFGSGDKVFQVSPGSTDVTSNWRSRLDEVEQIRVDRVCLRGGHAVGEVLLPQLKHGPDWPRMNANERELFRVTGAHGGCCLGR